MNHWTVNKANEQKTRLAESLAVLCRLRLDEWRAAFAQKFPRQRGLVRFGNGTEHVEIGGKIYGVLDTSRYPRSLESFRDAMDDINTITDGYTLSCPDDFAF
jgi:hypothetical protein